MGGGGGPTGGLSHISVSGWVWLGTWATKHRHLPQAWLQGGVQVTLCIGYSGSCWYLSYELHVACPFTKDPFALGDSTRVEMLLTAWLLGSLGHSNSSTAGKWQFKEEEGGTRVLNFFCLRKYGHELNNDGMNDEMQPCLFVPMLFPENVTLTWRQHWIFCLHYCTREEKRRRIGYLSFIFSCQCTGRNTHSSLQMFKGFECLKHSYCFTVENKWHVHKCALVLWFYSLPSFSLLLLPLHLSALQTVNSQGVGVLHT